MGSKSQQQGTPQPWVEMLRRHWAKIHTVEVHWRTNNRGSFVSVPDGAQAAARDADDEPLEGPEAAAELAGSMYQKCWAHLEATDDEIRRRYYEISAYEYKDDGQLVLLEAVNIGGGLGKDGTVRHDDDDEKTDSTRTRTREDFIWEQFKESSRMHLASMKATAGIIDSFKDIVNSAIDAKANVASKEWEREIASENAETERVRTEEAGKAFREMVQAVGPAANAWAAAKTAETSRAEGRKPHANPAIEAARLLSDALDSTTVGRLFEPLGSELVQDCLRVLALAQGDEPDVAEIRGAWEAVAPSLLLKKDAIEKALPTETAQKLVSALQNFHLQIMATAKDAT